MQTAGVTCVAVARQSTHQKASNRRHANLCGPTNKPSKRLPVSPMCELKATDRGLKSDTHWRSASIHQSLESRVQFTHTMRIPHTALASTRGLYKASSGHTNWLVWHWPTIYFIVRRPLTYCFSRGRPAYKLSVNWIWLLWWVDDDNDDNDAVHLCYYLHYYSSLYKYVRMLWIVINGGRW